MRRNFSTDVIVLRNYPIGENHKGVVLLTRDHSILHAIAHGAASSKGKLRNLVSPFCEGTGYIYFEPVKKSYKFSDMDCRQFHTGIRSNLVKFFTASLWAEVVLHSFGGGGPHDDGEAYALFTFALSLLEDCIDKSIVAHSVQFIWRYLKILGLQPELNRCASCSRILEQNEPAVLSSSGHSLLCTGCSGGGGLILTAGALKYLKTTGKMEFRTALRVGLEPASMTGLKEVFYRLLQEILEQPLKTLRAGTGIL
jgi:DNA repair protein RecO (recombination protein O)